ncbi:MAG: potassium-transporting ATPase subunit KdpC [Gemmatimonadaceae bacterium]
MHKLVRPAVSMTLVLCVITGVLYPAAVTGLAQALFPRQANGSLVMVNGRVVGSALIGQPFTRPEYSPASVRGRDRVRRGGVIGHEQRAHRPEVGGYPDRAGRGVGGARGRRNSRKIPSDMVTSSASGLDPHISPANAALQVARVARARRADSAAVQRLVNAHIERRQFGFFGEPRVNVLLLNIAVDSAFPVTGTTVSVASHHSPSR